MTPFFGGGELFFSDHLIDKIWVYNFVGSSLSIFGTVKIFVGPAGSFRLFPATAKSQNTLFFGEKWLILWQESPIVFSEHLNGQIWAHKFTKSNLYAYLRVKNIYRGTSTLPAALGHVKSHNIPFILVDFPANFLKFQNFVEQPIFVVQKR